MANALALETSPYLRQHAANPVDWLPWSPASLARARDLGRPILVSIGYSSCHWCHVMERESFEDHGIAALMNENLVCIKVDREERPDVDAIYMDALQTMTGQGGWPLNVFLTPDQLPFYGGTYFPPTPRHGMPSWSEVVKGVIDAWRSRRAEVLTSARQLTDHISRQAPPLPPSSPTTIDRAALDTAVLTLRESFDARNGGFGGAPKFPHASTIEFLICRATPIRSIARDQADSTSSSPVPTDISTGAREMALATLNAIAVGGIHDQIGGGVHRYAVDETWTVPHFEKMLYDNALLARAYLHGFQLSGERMLLDVCLDILRWALREMRGPEGGFYCALDADSEAIEGRFYVWTVAQLTDALGEDAAAAIAWLGATEEGNFSDPHHPQPGLNVLEGRGPVPPPAVADRIRSRLLAVRDRRVHPSLDDKRLTAWNALMVSSLAETGSHLLTADAPEDRALGADLLAAARTCADFILESLRDENGRLLRTYSGSEAKLDAYLEDHAFLLEALLVLFEATCEERWFTEARQIAEEIILRFADHDHGGFFATASDHETLIARRKDIQDTPTPSGTSSAAAGLLRLSELTGNHEYQRHGLAALSMLSEIAPRHPTAFGHLLQALHHHLSPARPIACAVPANPVPRPET